MKVVLFCGGMGMRLKEYDEHIPKPMVTVGYRPILWNVMKYYAHHGHKEFILCLGYRADYVKNYFLNYSECLSNDFTITDGGKHVALVNSDIHDWKITFADTGMTSNIAQRLTAVEKYLGNDQVFLANYSDGLSDFHLPELTGPFLEQNHVAGFLAIKPSYSFHVVSMQENGLVNSIHDLSRSDIWINAGYFIFRREIFNYIKPGEELVQEPFQRLIEKHRLFSHKYRGFWASMDTFKEKQKLDEMYARGDTPWEVWKHPAK